MEISLKTLEELRDQINEKTQCRSGRELVKFFNQLGFKDEYYRGFPPRSVYTEEKLKAINGTSDLDKCIKNLFAPVNFIGKYEQLGTLIDDFNEYLEYDGWRVVVVGKEISFSRVNNINIEEKIWKGQTSIDSIEDFLSTEFADISIDALPIDDFIKPYIAARIQEIKSCLLVKASLSVIFLSGSTLEGVLLGLAQRYPKRYNQANCAPKDSLSGSPKHFQSWTLSNLIDTSYELGFLREDVKKFSHSLRDFRNYIHPFQQMSEHFQPDENTAKICFQVLKAALYQITTQVPSE